MSRLESHRRASGTAWAICILYAIFLFAPRFDLVTHVHEHGDRPHHHGFLSAHESSAPTANLVPLEAGIVGVAPQKGIPHSHYQEDPNLSGLAHPSAPLPTDFCTLPPPARPAIRASAAAGMHALARAPPSPGRTAA